MSSNNEFPIPFEESRRGLADNQEEKAAAGRLGRYLASRGVDRPTIGEGRKRRRGANVELPTGGKPGTRNPTGSRRDIDGDGWADEGTTKPVWVGVDTPGDSPKKPKNEPATKKAKRLSSGNRIVDLSGMYDSSQSYSGKREPSSLLTKDKNGKDASAIRFRDEVLDIKTSTNDNGDVSFFIEDSNNQKLAEITLVSKDERLLVDSVSATPEAQKDGVLEAVLDSVLINNPETTVNLNSGTDAKTAGWWKHATNDATYGLTGSRQNGLHVKYFDGEDRIPDGDYLFRSQLHIGESKPITTSPITEKDWAGKDISVEWAGESFEVGGERVVFGAPEELEFDDPSVKKMPLNPFEISGLDPTSSEGREIALKWASAINAADFLVVDRGFSASNYVSALLYASTRGDKDAEKELDFLAERSSQFLEKIREKQLKLIGDIDEAKALPMNSQLVHQTSYNPTIDEDGYLVLRPLEDYPQTAKDGTEVVVNRTTMHFAINHLAEGHLFRQQTQGKSYVVIAPLDSFIEQNPDSLDNLSVVDTGATPPPGEGLRLAPGTFKLLEINEGSDAKKTVEDALRETGTPVFIGGERQSQTPGADEATRLRALLLDVPPVVASDIPGALYEQINRSNIKEDFQYSDFPAEASFHQEASKNNILRMAGRTSNGWVTFKKEIKTTRLSSGKAPRYPREPTLGAFLEGAVERFDGVNSWEEFKERYNETEMVFLDYETTGLNFDEFGKATANGNPTQIGLVRMKNGKEIGRLNLFMNPEEPLGEWSLKNLKDADGNPITNEWLATQMSMAEAHRQVAEFIGPDAIIGVQNATFDKTVLEDTLERDGIDWRPSGYLDTRDISAMTLPVWSEESPEGPYTVDRDGNKKPSSSLAAITEYLDVELGDGHHNADVDAFATSQVMQKIIDRAIENGWSTDVLDKEKRDAKLKADNDKFNADVEKFESDKESFIASREDAVSKLSSGARARRSIPPLASIREELNDRYKTSEMSDAELVRMYLKTRTYDANDLYESRHIDGRGGDEIAEHFSRFRDFIDNERISIDGMSDSEILEILKTGKYRSTIDSYDNAIDNIGPVPSKNSNRLSSGAVRELIPMKASPKKQEDSRATGYGKQGSSGKIVRRDSSTWLAGLSSDEISKVIIPTNAEEYFEMWADDIAGPTWRTDKNREQFIRNYYAELQKDPTNIPVDYSPESIAATQKLVKDLLDSSPSVTWVMQNLGAPLITPFTREGMAAYENSPDMKERLALLAKQRGTDKIPFISGLANRALGSIGISPRALIDRESLLNDDKGVYPISFDPDRVPAPRDAHIDRSLEGTIVHEFGHWLQHRALWDTETNGASGKMRSYFGTGKLSDPRYVASLRVAEEYADYETDDKRMEIYSQFIDLTGRSADEMFRAHPNEPLLSTSYGNVNKREAIAEAFVAIMHPNKEMPEKTLSKKLRQDIYALIGVDEKNLPWGDSETSPTNRLSSGANKGKRKTIFSRFRRDETEITEEKKKPPVVERPEGLVSFAPEPSEELLKVSPVPDEQTLRNEVLRDVQSLAFEFEGLGGDFFGTSAKSSIVAKKTIASNLSRSVDFDVEEFIAAFAGDKSNYGFHTSINFETVQRMYEALNNLPADTTDKERRAVARVAFDATKGRIVPAKIHDEVLGRVRYYDEILDELEKVGFKELFDPSEFSFNFADLTALDGRENSLFTPYLMTKLGTDDLKKELLLELTARRNVLTNLITGVKEYEGQSFALVKTKELNPRTGEPGYEIISYLGRVVDSNVIDKMLSLNTNDEDYDTKFAEVLVAFNGQLTGEKLREISKSGLIKIDSSNIDSPEVQKMLMDNLVETSRARSGNFELKQEGYTKKTGVVFFDLESDEGKQIVREALVSDLIHTWAISANNANPVALAVQHEIRKMFGLDEAVGWSTAPLRALPITEKEGLAPHAFDGAPELTEAQAAMIRPILQKIYDSTQLYYKAKGITHIPAYRGFTQSSTPLLPGELESMDTTMRPLSSWATSIGIASSFSDKFTQEETTPTLIKAFVPVEDVFSNALTGFGCLSEDEVVLLGKPMKVMAVRMDNAEQEVLKMMQDINITNIDEALRSIVERRESILATAEKIEELFESGSDMRNIDLSNANLEGKKLAGANLSGTNMQFAILQDIDLSGSDLTGAVLDDTNLYLANLSGADMSRAELARANMTNANLKGANLTEASMALATMNDANLTEANLFSANLTAAKLFDTNLERANLERAKLAQADMFRANLTDANLQFADMLLAQMPEAIFVNANLSGANLSSVNLIGANLSGANLSGANLTSALLRGANLEGADLTGANLQMADLTGANLNGAKLDGTSISGANFREEYLAERFAQQKLSSGKNSHTPKWNTVEEIVDSKVLGASEDDSEEDRDDIVKESVGGDWMQWDPCREIRTAAYELAGIDEYSERDPNISQSGGFFGNSKFQTFVSPEKRTEQARYLMASIVDSLINNDKYDRQPYLYRAMVFSSPEEGKQFFDAMQVGSQVDIPLLAFVEIGPSPRGDHFLTRFGSDALLVLEDFPGSYQTGGTFEPIFSNRHESDTLYNINEFAEAILADIENGEVDEENADYDKEFADKLIKLVEDYREAKDPLERSNIKIEIEEALDEVGNETIKREWEGEPLPEDHEEYYLAMEDEETGMTPREFVSGGRLEVVSVTPDPSKTYRQVVTLRQVGAFDPQEKGALVLKTDGQNSTKLSSGKNPSKKAKSKSVQLHDDEFEKKFNQKVPEGDGDCFSEAVQQARKLANAYDKVKIVHGYPLGTGGEAAGLRFPHAWAEFERDGEVWVRDYSNGNKFEFPKILYYAIGNIEEEDVSRYDIKEAETNMIENEHYGPW